MDDSTQDTRIERGPGAGPPKRFGRFETVSLLGRGGMGAVYLAEDRVIGRRVAIKEIPIEDALGETGRTERRLRFEVEIRAAGRLSHPAIATVYDAFESGGSYCIALEYVPGTSLDRRLEAGPPLSPAETVRIGEQIAAGLDHAHRLGIVHRDVKPGNVLLSSDGLVKITDFGIAKLVSLDLTQTGVALGTPAYMSPEQIQGKTLDGRSDQFSLAVMLYRMLTGKLPFDGSNPHTVLYRIVQEQPEQPGAINPALSPAMDRVLLRGLAKDPADRYPTCAAMVKDLAVALAGQAPAVRLQESAPQPPSRPEARRRVLPWILGFAAVLAVAGALGVLSLNDREEPLEGLSFPPASQTPEPRATPFPETPGTAPSAPGTTPSVPNLTPEEMPGETPAVLAAGTVEVEITSEPGRCRVSIDGRHAGFTPLTQALEPGRHQFNCEWPGQGTRSFEADITPQSRRLRFQR